MSSFVTYYKCNDSIYNIEYADYKVQIIISPDKLGHERNQLNQF